MIIRRKSINDGTAISKKMKRTIDEFSNLKQTRRPEDSKVPITSGNGGRANIQLNAKRCSGRSTRSRDWTREHQFIEKRLVSSTARLHEPRRCA